MAPRFAYIMRSTCDVANISSEKLSPTTAIIDSQAPKRGACIDPHGYDAGKKRIFSSIN